jgi:hypothetical protein
MSYEYYFAERVTFEQLKQLPPPIEIELERGIPLVKPYRSFCLAMPSTIRKGKTIYVHVGNSPHKEGCPWMQAFGVHITGADDELIPFVCKHLDVHVASYISELWRPDGTRGWVAHDVPDGALEQSSNDRTDFAERLRRDLDLIAERRGRPRCGVTSEASL